MFRLVSAGITVWAVVASQAAPALAQEASLTLRLLPTPNLSTQARLLRRLDEVAQPYVITPAAPGTLKDVIIRRCGFSSPVLEEGARRYNPGLDSSANLEGMSITVPACPYWRFNVPVDIGSVSTLSRAALAATGFVGNATLSALIARNPNLLDAKGKPRALAGSLILPYETRPFTLLLRPQYSNSHDTALLLAREFPTLLKTTYAENYVQGAGGVTFVIDPIVLGALSGCRGRANGWPFDPDAVADAIEKNAAVRNQATRYAPGIVLVADTGLKESDFQRFPMRRNDDEGGPSAVDGLDEDDNGYTDDIFGANMSMRPGPPSPLTRYADHGHGTQVAGMIFGPWMNARLQAIVRSKIGISAANIVQEDVVGLQDDGAPKLWAHVPPSNVERVFSYADRMLPKPVVNVSFKSDQPYPALSTLLKSAPYLVVVAVGNDGKPIDKSKNERYPAEYRRTFEGQILSVAAHDGSQKLASFSNHGPEVVDIAAPGCELPTIDVDGVAAVGSGTSLAAPLVSLTAALLYSEGLLDPVKVRDRIISASHFVPDLRVSVASSGALDIVKALRIYSDIVVLKASPQRAQETLFGRIANQDIKICGDALSWRSVTSVIPRFNESVPGAAMRILVKKSGKLIERRCEVAAGLKFTFQDERGGPPMVLSLDDVDQVVPAIR